METLRFRIKQSFLLWNSLASLSNHSMVGVEGSMASHELMVPDFSTSDVHTGPYGCIVSGDQVAEEYIDDGIAV